MSTPTSAARKTTSKSSVKTSKPTSVTSSKPSHATAKSASTIPSLTKQTVIARAAKARVSTPPAAMPSPFEIMAARIADRVANMAENVTLTERTPAAIQPSPQPQPALKKSPRKLDIHLGSQAANSVKFSAPFLDSTLAKMLDLQNRMLKSSSSFAASDISETMKRDQFEQSAELSRIIALICAEKARQGA